MLPIFVPTYVDGLFTYATILALPLAVWAWLKSGKIGVHALCFALFSGFVFLVASVTNNLNPYFFKYARLVIEAHLVFFIITRLFEKSDLPWILAWIARFSIITFSVLLFQYLSGSSQEYIVNDAAGFRTYARLVPYGFDPNYYFLNLVLPLCFFWGKLQYTQQKFRRVILFFGGLAIIVNVIGLASKSAMILTILLVGLLFVRRGKRYLLFVGLLTVISFPLILQNFEYSIYRWQTLIDGFANGNSTKAMTGRNILYNRTWETFIAHPFGGVGLGQIVKEYESLASLSSRGLGTTHNSYLHLLGETGLLGATLFIAPFLQVFRKAYKHRYLNWTNHVLFTAFVVSLLMLLTIDAFYYKAFIVLFSLIVLNSQRKTTTHAI
jgi:O-antigen ligase